QPLISGTGEAGDTVTVGDATGTAVCAATVTTSGTWSCTATAPLDDGEAVLTPTATDPAGNSTPGAGVHVKVDTTAPPAPVITAPADQAATSDTTPEVSGTGEPGDRVSVSAGNAACSATVDRDGAWACTFARPLITSGTATVTLTPTQSDSAGNA